MGELNAKMKRLQMQFQVKYAWKNVVQFPTGTKKHAAFELDASLKLPANEEIEKTIERARQKAINMITSIGIDEESIDFNEQINLKKKQDLIKAKLMNLIPMMKMNSKIKMMFMR